MAYSDDSGGPTGACSGRASLSEIVGILETDFVLTAFSLSIARR